MIIVEGSVQTRSYEDRNGNTRKAVEIVADNVQFGEPKSAGRDIRSEEPPLNGARDYGGASYKPMDTGDSDDLPF